MIVGKRFWMKLLVAGAVCLCLMVGVGDGGSTVEAGWPGEWPGWRNILPGGVTCVPSSGGFDPTLLARCPLWLVTHKFGAGGYRTEDTVGCWVSGTVGGSEEDSWGAADNDFAASLEEVYEGEMGRSQLGRRYQPERNNKVVGGFFRNVPELVDYSFAMSLASSGGDLDGIDDDRVRELKELVWGSGVLGPGGEVGVPWSKRSQYLQRRAVARWAENRLVSLEAGWWDPDNPGGGSGIDHAAMNRDLLAGQLDAAAATTTMMGGGGRTTFSQQQVPMLKISTANVGGQCVGEGGGVVCSWNQDLETEAEKVEVRSASYTVNSGEVEGRRVGRGERVVLGEEAGDEKTVMVDATHYGPSQALARSRDAVGYAREGARDIGNSRIVIDLELDEGVRKDFNITGNIGYVGNRELAAFGWDAFTYERIGLGRWFGYNGVETGVGDGGGGGGGPDPWDGQGYEGKFDSEENSGYRQPALNRVVVRDGGSLLANVASEGDVRANVEHIRWPVNFEDMNWYLYEVPNSAPDTSLFYYWLSVAGGKRLAWSGYGVDAADLENGFDPQCVAKGPPNEQKNIECAQPKDPLNWVGQSLDKMKPGDGKKVFMPFDVWGGGVGLTDDFTGLNRRMLMRMGVASPEDQGEGSGGRKLSRFRFEVSEGDDPGAIEKEGWEGKRRLGIPEKDDLAARVLEEWPAGDLNPNGIYLLVVTFYEKRHDDAVTFVMGDRLAEGEDVVHKGTLLDIRVPKRQVRRVICRILVRNIGFQASRVEGTSVVDKATQQVREMLTDVGEDIRRLVADATRGVMKSPPWAGRKLADVECAGMDRLDELTTGGSSEVEQVRMSGGSLVVNEAVVGRYNGIEECERVSEERKVTCDSSVEYVFEGKCVQLPKMELSIVDGEFVDVKEEIGYEAFDWFTTDENWVRQWRPEPVSEFTGFAPTMDPEGQVRRFVGDRAVEIHYEKPNLRNQGLSRVHVGWNYKWGGVHSDALRAISGWKVAVFADQRASDTIEPVDGRVFYLPRMIKVRGTTHLGGGEQSGSEEIRVFPVEGFWFGSLGKDEEGDDLLGDHFWPGRKGVPPGLDGRSFDVNAVGGEEAREEYKRFNAFLDRLPVAKGWKHSFVVYPVAGELGSVLFEDDTLASNTLVVDGNKAACETRTDEPGDLPGTFKLPPKVDALYYCTGVGSREEGGAEVAVSKFGLLGLVGTEQCGDIFSSTPPAFTWDNEVVRNVWLLMLVLGGAVLFSLVVWQGLRMTYDVWLEPQPAVGLREMLPRFLLAVVLAAGSLAICELVLVLATDVTCFVAQATGMSMWGFLGTSVGSVLRGFEAWMEAFHLSINGLTLPALMGWGVVYFLLASVVVIFVILILILFLLVAFAMLTRIALLAVLVAFAPLAFAFYASNVTSHWTKKWVSIFLGTTFQQVVILLVVFLGGNLVGDYLATGAEGEFDVLMIGMILGAMTLYLALKVPGIVNPAGAGVFEGFGQMGQMAVAGGVMLMSVGAGAAIGGARGAFGGIGGSAGGVVNRMRGRIRGGGGSQPGGDDDGAAGGVSTGAPSGGPPGGGGVRARLASSPSSPSGGFAGGPGTLGGGAPLGGGGGADEGEKQPGFLRRTYQGARQGVVRGGRFAGGVNTRMADLRSGSFLYRGRSTGDDSAVQVGRLRTEQAARAKEQTEAYDRMAQVLDRLNQKLP